MSEDTGQRLIRLGMQAEILKNSEAFDLAVAALEQDIVAEWAQADTVGAREQAHAKISVLQEVVSRLDTIIGAAEIEKDKKDKREKEDK